MENIEEILAKNNQSHVLKFYSEIEDKQKLEKQILSLDFNLLNKLYQNKAEETKASKIEPIDYISKENLSGEQKEYYTKIGTEAIKQGKIAVCQMAGGQRNKAWS